MTHNHFNAKEMKTVSHLNVHGLPSTVYTTQTSVLENPQCTQASTSTNSKSRRRKAFQDINNLQGNEAIPATNCFEDIPNPVCQKKSKRWKGLENFVSNVPPKRIRKKPSVNKPSTQQNCHTIYNFGHKTTIEMPANDNLIIQQQEHYSNITLNMDTEAMADVHSDHEHSANEADAANVDEPTPCALKTAKGRGTKKREICYIDEGDPTYECKYCHALMWYNERVKKDRNQRQVNLFSMCCLQGKVVLPRLKDPPPCLRSLFFDVGTEHSKNFIKNIRQYNNMFSFTSMGGKINHAINNGKAPYTYQISGMNHHTMGNLMPPEGGVPVYSQLYIHDTENEVTNRINAVSKHTSDITVDPIIVSAIKDELDATNQYVKQFRLASQMISSADKRAFKMVLLGTRQHDGRTYNLPTASEVAALIVGDLDTQFHVRDIVVETHEGNLQRINELHPAYLPLQYPLLFPYGEDGYRDDVKHREETLELTKTKKRVSIREYSSYKLMMRECEMSTLLSSSKLLQQFIVDTYTMLEAQRLLWYRTHQKELRADLYKGLEDAVINGETNASATGKRIVLPSSFTGGARYMMGNYQDAMAICRTIGYPDMFITFTCNPSWPEVTRLCEQKNLKPSDCPHILSRVFYMKLKQLMKVLKTDKIFGQVRADIYTIEFQKRGLPHAHILLFLSDEAKLSDPESIDKIISAEIPDKENDPQLYDLVQRFMMHGPCVKDKQKAKCMKDNKCDKYFPKNFEEETKLDEDGYPTYKRRKDGRTIEMNHIPFDNRFVVPYNPTLLKMFQAHINIEKCNQSTAIKYLFKYISKGGDRVVVGLFDHSKDGSGQAIFDEIQQYLNCRYISACEASWRVFGFPIHHRYPSVERLSFHLPNHQFIVYPSNVDVADLLDKPRVCESQFLSWMETNDKDSEARELTYSEFPTKYTYQKPKRTWKRRETNQISVGRMPHIGPSAGELYYLRVLLTQVRGPRSFDEIKTVDGVVHETFKDACFARGLLDDDREFISAIKEAATWATGKALRKLFVSMLLCGSLHRPNIVWEATASILSDDMFYIPRNDPSSSEVTFTQAEKENAALRDINELLHLNGKSLHDYGQMPVPDQDEIMDVSNHLILQELKYDRLILQEQSLGLIKSLNVEQMAAYSEIMKTVQMKQDGFFFVYGFGGTGKTFLWNALASSLRAKGKIVLTVASSGIAATLLPGGRTAHSRFAIPIHVDEFSVCNIWHNSPLANLLRATSLIIWDEAPMVQRYCVEAFNRSMQDVMQNSRPFGGKCIVMGGDFRQILPVIPKGMRATIVNACINSSFLWRYCKMFHLTQNMRLNSSNDPIINEKISNFSKWLLEIGDGKIGPTVDGQSQVEIPENLLLDSGNNSVSAIVSWTYDNLLSSLFINSYFNDRAILAPTIEMVDLINNHMCSLLPGESHEYLSCDRVCQASLDSDTVENLYTTEFLNTISSSGMAPHRLNLKVGSPIMLLRNIDQEAGLCNGTRLRVTKLGSMVIEAVTLNGSKPNERVLIHRMDMNPSDSRFPFKMQRRQFPVMLSFAMTINKSQGQSLKKVGLYLSKPVFTHGQLYVALSRVKSIDGLKIVLGNDQQKGDHTTTNVVYQEIFMNVNKPQLEGYSHASSLAWAHY